MAPLWTGYLHLSCSACTSPMIWNGHNTLMQSRLRLHHGCTFWDNWNVPEHLPVIWCVSTAQSFGQSLNTRVQSGIPAWQWLSLMFMESLQKRAMNVILTGVDYTMALIIAGIDTLCDRREKRTRRFFTRHVLDETSCLHYLLPPKCDDNITARLRKTRLFQNYRAKTNGFDNSFIPYCVRNF